MKLARYGLWAAWIVAVLATATSLTLSEIYHLVPCVLCWYQRICMFPLVVILGVGILRRDRHAYALCVTFGCDRIGNRRVPQFAAVGNYQRSGEPLQYDCRLRH
jgi:hypothetical protein